jgi:ABC-type uncharacterized transport system permease subunit
MNSVYISSVDRSHPVGDLVGKYGDNQYWLGVRHGILIGTTVGGFFAVLLSKFLDSRG